MFNPDALEIKKSDKREGTEVINLNNESYDLNLS